MHGRVGLGPDEAALAGPDVPRDRAAGIVESIAAEHASQRTAEQRVHRPGMSTPPRGIPFEIIEQSRRVDMAGYVMVLEPDVAPVRPRP